MKQSWKKTSNALKIESFKQFGAEVTDSEHSISQSQKCSMWPMWPVSIQFMLAVLHYGKT